MVKHLLKLIFCAFVLSNGMAYASSQEFSGEEKMVDAIAIDVRGQTVNVKNAKGLSLEVYSVTGSCVVQYKVDAVHQVFKLHLKKGCYIVRVGDVARKIYVL